MKELDLQTIHAFFFDNDGVMTNTAHVHLDVWNDVSGEMLRRRADVRGSSKPFAREHDLTHVDSMRRYGRRCRFFASRGIGLPDGNPGDRTTETEHGGANLRDYRFRGDLERPDIPLFQDAHTWIGRLRRGIRGDVFSASRHAQWVLDSAQATRLFECVVDITDAVEPGPLGKPGLARRDGTGRRTGFAPERGPVIRDAILAA